jgi:hypothetical protein
MCSTVLFSWTLAPTSSQVTPAGLRIDLGDDVHLTLGVADLLECLGGIEVVQEGDAFQAWPALGVPVVGVGLEHDPVGAVLPHVEPHTGDGSAETRAISFSREQ